MRPSAALCDPLRETRAPGAGPPSKQAIKATGCRKTPAPTPSASSRKGKKELAASSGPAKIRPASTAAVSVTCVDRESYAEVMKLARSQINLEALEIGDLRPRRAVTGALILEVRGVDNAEKADALANELREVMAHRSDVRIARPSKSVEIRITGLEDSVTTEEVASTVGNVGGCFPHEVKVGVIRRGPNGLGTCWLRCPVRAGKALLAAPRFRVGWSSCRATLLPSRGLQCYRCLAAGHTQAGCSNQVDRTGCCYRCGGIGHQASTCANKACCPVCLDKGKSADHRVGSKSWQSTAKRGGAPRTAAAQPANKGSQQKGVAKERAKEGADRQLPSGSSPPSTAETASSSLKKKRKGMAKINPPPSSKGPHHRWWRKQDSKNGREHSSVRPRWPALRGERVPGRSGVTDTHHSDGGGGASAIDQQWLRGSSTNLKHARAAQDILLQCLAERGVGLAIAAHPYRIPDDHPHWAGDTLGRVTIVSQHARDDQPMLPVESGEEYVLVEWGPIDVLGVYFPPSLSQGEYEAALERTGETIFRRSPRPIIVGGDFNAHAVAWGSPTTNPRGRLTLEWAAGLDLALLNRGRVSTFVGGRGESIVDLTWASPGALDRVSAWRVETPLGELTDHRLIEMEVASTPVEVQARNRRQRAERRLVLRKPDQDALEVSLTVSKWADRGQNAGAEAEAEWLCDAMSRACDASMPRSRPRAKRAAYWWSEELAQLRRATVTARRAFTRARGRGMEAEVEETRAALKDARKALRVAIARAKAEAWDEFISGLTRDP
ncbi:uncharacterized protein LOC120357348 [Solenopsis invicta]|uniref:uncharacterized protein LOC120357348 n=1 Tax=Solenopsis invicta TaxID=13686 RepID=UPI00193D5F48|nr:uncharacterized protein LOC120357348 [Solenopsis invicta]